MTFSVDAHNSFDILRDEIDRRGFDVRKTQEYVSAFEDLMP